MGYMKCKEISGLNGIYGVGLIKCNSDMCKTLYSIHPKLKGTKPFFRWPNKI